ncbi:uncharacterized protein (TIGR02001 family) [Rhodoblastus sphagnicola]|nr:TorF family putative porin [Rhodoblastus sphagnicola]MBB4197848.1 uncharacterized protein (TIGR02001 family) [Rhodoblastus sphagnicola]
MNKLSLAAVVLAASAGTAFAGDLPSTKAAPVAPIVTSPWDYDIGAGLTSDYLFRGITQSNHQPSVSAHGEIRYNWTADYQFYVGVSGESIKFTNNIFPVGSPALELDGFGGIRGTHGAFSFDLGAIGYGYPDSPTNRVQNAAYTSSNGIIGLAPRNPTFFEIYFKPSYAINDALSLGLNVFYTPSYLNTGADGEYLSGTVKYTLPGQLSAFALSGEFGHQWLGKLDSVYRGANSDNYVYLGDASGKLPDYNYWNAGVSYTWKFLTLDLRYYGTDLSRAAAYQLVGIPTVVNGTNCNYADDRFVATLSFDLTSKDLK